MSLRLPEDIIHPSKWSAKDPWKDGNPAPGAYPSSPQPDHGLDLTGQRSLASAVTERRQDYVRKKNIRIKVGTWNVASINSTHKDLAAWFLQGLGVKGLTQDLSGLAATDESDLSDNEQIESVEDQEARAGRKQSTVPIGEVAAIPSDDDVGIYALGLQEVIDISSITEAMRPYYDPDPAKRWKRAVKRGLPRGYVKIAEQQLLGLLLLVYAAPDVATQITSVSCTSVGTGALGYMGNKGAVSVRLVLGGTTRLLFVNCHLAAGADQAALTRRIWDTNQIISRTKFDPAEIDGDVSSTGNESIGDEDFAFWFGDLNYRLDNIPGEDVRRLLLLHTRNEYDIMNKSRMRIDSELGYIDAVSKDDRSNAVSGDDSAENGGKPAKDSAAEPALDPKDDPASLITTLNSLLQHDQLREQQRLRKAFHNGWREGTIDFLPTYKYDIGSVGMFDSGEKKRSPSWCDRILYRTRRDRLNYEERVKSELDTRTRDEEAKAQGLAKDVAEQEILFDYDPDTDGANEYDDYDETEDVEDTRSVITDEGMEDTISLEKYLSHQRVLSSDHKPLSAIFNLTYDAVIPELKARVQQEVARMLDKNENETRPNITVVVDNPVENSANADRRTGATELSSAEFGDVRYKVPKTRTLTVANTGPIPATFAFINRPTEPGQETSQFPSWMNIQVHHDSQPSPKVTDDLGTSTRFTLSPGDIATIDITIEIEEKDVVHALNEEAAKLDEVLVLRVLNGRDHFVSVHGVWLSSSFHRSLDELVRFPNGVRSQPGASINSSSDHRRGSEAFHSAPKELFDMTEALPGLVERAVADWAMLNDDSTPPWVSDASWPFYDHTWVEDGDEESGRLAAIREALDTASPIAERIDEELPALARVELLVTTLVSFLQSLQDGIITATVWHTIEEKLTTIERSKGSGDHFALQEIVMEALSTTPVHSVSLTFITFMLTRIATEVCTNLSEAAQTPMSPISRRNRSSTETSEASSEFSVKSTASNSTLSSFLPSLTRRKAAATPSTTASASDHVALSGTKRYLEAYADFWANILIRSERDAQVKGKDKKTLDSRKRRVLEALLDSPTM